MSGFHNRMNFDWYVQNAILWSENERWYPMFKMLRDYLASLIWYITKLISYHTTYRIYFAWLCFMPNLLAEIPDAFFYLIRISLQLCPLPESTWRPLHLTTSKHCKRLQQSVKILCIMLNKETTKQLLRYLPWICRWYTLCAPCSPSLITIRKPSGHSFFPTLWATYNKWPRISFWSSLAFDNFVSPSRFFGITITCTGAWGWMSPEQKGL